MTKAKMPVAQHPMSRAEDARTKRVRTEELTLHKASVRSVVPFGMGLQAFLNCRAAGVDL